MESGLIPSRRDIRTLNHEQQFGSIPLSSLPKNGLGRKPLSIKDQRQSLLCTGFATATASEYIEGVEMSPEFQAALIGTLEGRNIYNTGASIPNALKAVRLGSLAKKDYIYDLEEDGEDASDPRNVTSELKKKAEFFRKDSTYDIMGGSYDIFDNIRVALFLAKEAGEERTGMAFTRWYEDSWNDSERLFYKGTGRFSWHAHNFIDWEWDKYLNDFVMIEQNNYGKSWGKGGLSRWTREAVNQLSEDPMNQVHMARDYDPEKAKADQWSAAIQAYNAIVKIDPTGAIKWLVEFINGWLTNWEEKPAPAPAPTPVPPPVQKSRIEAWAKAIQKQEGGRPQDLNMRNNNPGNLKYTTYTSTLAPGCSRAGAGSDGGHFCKWDTPEHGYQALCQFLRDAAQNKLKSYKNCTLDQFTSIYALPPNKNYVNGVAKDLGVSTNILIKELL